MNRRCEREKIIRTEKLTLMLASIRGLGTRKLGENEYVSVDRIISSKTHLFIVDASPMPSRVSGYGKETSHFFGGDIPVVTNVIKN